MTTNDPLRTMRDEIHDSMGCRLSAGVARRWLSVLDAHLSAPRCPECDTLEAPILNANQQYAYATCGAMRCDRQTESANDAEAVAKFYEAPE